MLTIIQYKMIIISVSGVTKRYTIYPFLVKKYITFNVYRYLVKPVFSNCWPSQFITFRRELLHIWHWQSDDLTTRLDLIHWARSEPIPCIPNHWKNFMAGSVISVFCFGSKVPDWLQIGIRKRISPRVWAEPLLPISTSQLYAVSLVSPSHYSLLGDKWFPAFVSQSL